MIVSLAEFKADPDRYLELVDNEEITIIKEKKHVPILSRPVVNNKGDIIRSLVGILPPDITEEEAREARMAKHEKNYL